MNPRTSTRTAPLVEQSRKDGCISSGRSRAQELGWQRGRATAPHETAPFEVGQEHGVIAAARRGLDGDEIRDGRIPIDDSNATPSADVLDVPREVVLGIGYLDYFHKTNLARTGTLVNPTSQAGLSGGRGRARLVA